MRERDSAEQPPDSLLPATERRLHRALIGGLLATGAVPAETTLAADLGIDLGALGRALRALERADYLALDPAGRVTCLYPFSTAPTAHVVVVDGARRFAMCSLDALGMAAMLGRPVAIESACAACGRPVRIVVHPGQIAAAEPAETTVVAKRATDAPAVEACCDYTVFACGPPHARDLLTRTPDAAALDLKAALQAGEALFAGLLGETLPARRNRARAVAIRDG